MRATIEAKRFKGPITSPSVNFVPPGVGARNPYPYSAQVGVINGGVINGIAGNDADEPILDTRFAMDWRTTEYWGPGVSYLVKAITALEGAA